MFKLNKVSECDLDGNPPTKINIRIDILSGETKLSFSLRLQDIMKYFSPSG